MNEGGRNSVLIVDDENSSIMALTNILSPEYIVYAAKNGQDAIKAAEKFLPDVILLDILMPDMDGYAVIASIKNSVKTRNIPVIFITGISGVGAEEKGLTLGASDYISKPFSPTIVKLRVKNQVKVINKIRLIVAKDAAEKNSRAELGEARVIIEPMPYGSVLVVDDAELNLYVVKELLGLYKLSVDTATSGFEAIDKIKGGKEYDIVFMDHMMPEMDGMEATKIMRGLGYTRPIVALTANVQIGWSDTFLASGFDGLVSKPIDMSDLNAVLNKFIRCKQQLLTE